MNQLACFKAYDVRGRVPADLDAGLAHRIGSAFVAHLGARRVVVGQDIRLSSPDIAAAVADGLAAAGADVIDIGRCGTEEVYFATFHLGVDGGIMVTASHNPAEYNGMKMVREGGRPVSADTGLLEIGRLACEGHVPAGARRGTIERVDTRDAYVGHLLGYIDRSALRPLTIVANAGNGGAGAVLDALEPHLPFRFIKVNHEPDGHFPNGVPNPILPENRRATAEAVLATGADLGIAWDGDFDRCFFFDHQGRFVEGCYVVAMLATRALERHPGAAIVHDPRVVWNTIDVVRAHGGTPVQSKGGHAFMKETMRRVDAAYGGENPGHHFFREFAYCDSGMIPWLQVVEHVCRTGRPLGEMVEDMVREHPASGELNFQIADPAAVTRRVRQHFEADAGEIETLDGLTMEFAGWRFNLRSSNTEPLVRLNVEALDPDVLREKTAEVVALLGAT